MAKTWKELDAFVHQSRLQQFQYSTSIPTQFTFHQGHLFFLGIPPISLEGVMNENTLLYTDLDDIVDEIETDFNISNMIVNEDSSDISQVNASVISAESQSVIQHSTYKWRELLEQSVPMSRTSSGGQSYSKEEELLRERKRLSAHGITSYEFHHETGRILFSTGKSLYWLDVGDLVKRKSQVATAFEIPTGLPGCRMDAKLCNNNANIVSFIFSGDIWVANIETGQELRLTFARSIGRDDAVSAGVPSFVMQEEFDRFTGYWWEPKLDCSEIGDVEVHRILYELVDERMVEKHYIVPTPDTNQHTSHVDTYRYPRAGTTNARSSLRLVEFCVVKSTNEFIDGSIVEYELRRDLQELMPWVEYLVRCGWMDDGKNIWAQILDRRQKRLALLRIPMAAFRVISATTVMSPEEPFQVEILWEERSSVWINLSEILHFLPSSTTNSLKFIWSSESSGYRHLYLINVATKGSVRPSGKLMNSVKHDDRCPLHICDTLSVAQLTEGEWEISANQPIWVDEKQQFIYFIGTKDTPLERHLYVTSYKSAGPIQRLTQPGMYHAVTIDNHCTHAVILSSSLKVMPQIAAYRISNAGNPDDYTFTVSEMCLDLLGWLEAPQEIPPTVPRPELMCYKNKYGYDIYGLMFKPKEMEPDKKYPTLIFVYGGPAVQLVTNSQKAFRRVGLQSITSLGYIVLVVDPMGSAHRGLQFEAHLKDKMGTVEIQEQVEAIEFVAKSTGIIDMERIAIHGWSYGGYLSLLGLAQRPDIFKIAIAGAPVTSWELYDTGYTERYMDLPMNNIEGYKQGSVANYVQSFPNEQNRLLILHGMIDENVHFSHTNFIVNHLIKEGKPYQIQIYPCERHGFRHPASAQHYETTILWFLLKNL